MADKLKYRDYIFWWICFCVPFVSMNRNLFPWGGFFGGFFSHNLVAWPIFIGVLYSTYLQWTGTPVFVWRKWIIVFTCGTLLIEVLSFVHGAYVFPYWELIDNTPLPEKSRISQIIEVLQENGFFLDEPMINRYFTFYSIIKDRLLKLVISYGGMYMIYCWYRNDYRRAIEIMEKAVIASALMLYGYCTIEFFALLDVPFFQDMLFRMDVFLHFPGTDKVAEIEQWLKHWVLGAKQMRGYFTEPSLLGLYANVIASFLWYWILKESNKYAIVCNVFLGVIVVMTSSRTAFGIYCAMIVLLVVILFYKRQKSLFFKGGVIVISSVLAFYAGTFLIKNVIVDSGTKVVDSGTKVVDSGTKVVDSGTKVVDSNKHASYVKSDVGGYFESNIGSLADVKARSNPARYTYAYCAFKTGMEHPILGVGVRFRSAYALKYIPDWGKNNREVSTIVKNQQEKGFFRVNFPVLNEYLLIFAENGILGVAWYLFPFGFIIWKICMNIKKMHANELITCVLLLELLLGVVLAGINNSWSIFYSTWVVLAIALAFVEQNEAQLEM